MHARDCSKGLVVSLYSVAPGDVCPGASTAVKDPGSQPASALVFLRSSSHPGAYQESPLRMKNYNTREMAAVLGTLWQIPMATLWQVRDQYESVCAQSCLNSLRPHDL